MPILRTTLSVAGVLILTQFVSGCDEKTKVAEAPPTMVSVVSVQPETLAIMNELPGRIAPTRIAEVTPRVSGIVVERVFVQGSVVKQGDVLYRLDSKPFAIQVSSAEAALDHAKAVQQQARQQATRQTKLRETEAASVQQYDNAVAVAAQADADVASAEAGLEAAKLNLQYTNVTAPISGRIGRALITEGALVGPSSGSLATIQQLDPIYADFTQSASDLLRLQKRVRDAAVGKGDLQNASVHLLFDDRSRYPDGGKLLFSEAAVDATTGQVTLRGEFPNANGDLLPGMYVRIQIEQGIQNHALAVPQQAVQRDTAGSPQLYIAKADDTLELRNVNLGRAIDMRWIVDEGLKPGDRVVVQGFQKLAPGAKVATQPWTMAATGSPSNEGRREGGVPDRQQPAN
jgi:membrane fusion protein, multidrug efflux system